MTFSEKTLRELHAACEYRDIELRVSPVTHDRIAPQFRIGPP
jgi:hypothetical protein